jgi:hypothetical protein
MVLKCSPNPQGKKTARYIVKMDSFAEVNHILWRDMYNPHQLFYNKIYNKVSCTRGHKNAYIENNRKNDVYMTKNIKFNNLILYMLEFDYVNPLKYGTPV